MCLHVFAWGALYGWGFPMGVTCLIWVLVVVLFIVVVAVILDVVL